MPDARYAALDAQYAKEQDTLSGEITVLKKAISGYEQSRKSAEKFISLVEKYERFDKLTTTMLNEFVERILIHERARKGSQDTTQEVEIYFTLWANMCRHSLEKSRLRQRNRKPYVRKRNARTGYIRAICGEKQTASRKSMRNG